LVFGLYQWGMASRNFRKRKRGTSSGAKATSKKGCEAPPEGQVETESETTPEKQKADTNQESSTEDEHNCSKFDRKAWKYMIRVDAAPEI
jgi:hypothetical protein